ncbi:hypothetical protein Acr_17g0004210 [Actinidia rufa]|uniref:Uncharacterized protein n=1 Tax=Actinidia rufa TaxID=165716 RepID=A0A7J0G260_9ERIC|nr:hypothetical protein Acr_17g0004210 [Actinidia rufa]
MGGGATMRAAAKVAGISVVNSRLSGVPALSPAEYPASVAHKVTRPASAIVSLSDEMSRSVCMASHDSPTDPPPQRLCWELDDWEFTGGEEEVMVCSGDPMRRVVFGGVPTLEEATEATSELKDALEKVYLSSSSSTGGGDPYAAGHESDFLAPLSKSEFLETKACVTSELTAISVQQNAMKAFRLLNESEVVQSIVASIVRDPNVWQAIQKNEALVRFSQSHKSNMDPFMKESGADATIQGHQSPKSVADSSDDPTQFAFSGNGVTGFLEGLKTTVVEMVNNLSNYFEYLFVGSATERVPENTVGSARRTFSDGAMTASFMGLAVMVIMVVVLKRG